MQTRVGPLFKRQSIMASVVALLVGGLVLLSWAFDIPVLGRLHSGLITMKANTAACFILSATALLLFCKEQGSKSARFLAYVFAVTAAGVGALTLTEIVTHLDFHIDQLLVTDRTVLATTFPPGRMSPGTASNFVYLGVALTLLGMKRAFGLMQSLVLLIVLYSVF